MKYTAYGERVLIQPIRKPASAVLHDPTMERVKPAEKGTIVRCLPNDQFAEGDVVVFNPHDSDLLPVDEGEPELMTVPIPHVLAVCEPTTGE